MSKPKPAETLHVRLRGEPPAGPVRVGEQPLLVGREAGCAVVIPDPTVSRRHAWLSVEEGQLVVEDAGSSGGTYVNEKPVVRQVVRPGDTLRFGVRALYVVEIDSAVSTLGRAALAGGEDRAVRQLRTLLEVAHTLNTTTVLSEVLEVVLRSAVALMAADQGCVVVTDEAGRRRLAVMHPPGQAESGWGVESTLLERAMGERRTVTVELGTDPHMSAIRRGFTSAVATPLLVARRVLGGGRDASFAAKLEVVGGILLERRLLPTGFVEEDLAVLESLAADAAAAIDSARLYRESRAKARIDHEMELARTIQRALLRDPPQTNFCDVYALSAAARTVGGDLYHGFLRRDGTLAVAVGDVSGKGVAAALIMAMAQGLLSLLHDLALPLSELAAALNRNLAHFNPGNRFLTLAAALIDPHGHLQVCNAGHCPALVVRRGGELEPIPASGPVLGILEDAQWRPTSVRMHRGDVLVLYSDGIVESFGPDGRMFGEEGLYQALSPRAGQPPRALAEGLMIAASNHRRGGEPDDDVTILAARYRG